MGKNIYLPSRCYIKLVMLTLICIGLLNTTIYAQGTWLQLNNVPPDYNNGVMLLLSDGTVICKTSSGSGSNGTVWDKLTPDSFGSYANGTWSTIAPMHNDRLYFSSQILMNGQVYVAGGEYGSGYGSAEIYEPLANTWTPVPQLTSGDTFFDACSEILPDGKVMQSNFNAAEDYKGNYIYDKATNTFSHGPTCHSYYGEAEVTWIKLADSSILFVDFVSTTSERYIPSLNEWIEDATVPINIYDSVSNESGPGFLLPDGRAFLTGGGGVTAFYTPTGTTSPGTWVAGPMLPNGQGIPDGPGSMMVNGKILLVTSPIPYRNPTDTNYFPSPMSFYEFDYLTDSFTQIPSPFGGDTLTGAPFYDHLLNLPDGTILFSEGWTKGYAIYVPDGSPLVSGQPTINTIIPENCDTYQITGMLFNGITEGSSYGDDWQMATNYPIVRLTTGTNVYYARTYNWNSTGVMTGSQADTTTFVLPPGLPGGTYSLTVSANGNASAPTTFTYTPCTPAGIAQTIPISSDMNVYPNPANTKTTVSFNSNNGGLYTMRFMNMIGQIITEESGTALPGTNNYTLHLNGTARGVYVVVIEQADQVNQVKVMVE